MTREAFLKRFDEWQSPPKPHRPILILYALREWHYGRARRIAFLLADKEYPPLLQQVERLIGREPPKKVNTEDPFSVLEGEPGAFWKVEAAGGLPRRPDRRNIYQRGGLSKQNTPAGFTEDVLAEFKRDPILVFDVADRVLNAWKDLFPPDKHAEILELVGLVRPPGEPELAPPVPPSGGAGFGNPETNPEVERAAVDFVTNEYRRAGWSVNSVERDRCGFDLDCHRGTECEHVEVKGTSGTEQEFFITANEVRCAESDPRFVLCVVTSVAMAPKLTRYSGHELLSHFDLVPIQYRARLKPKASQ